MKPLILPGYLSSVRNDLKLTQDELGEQLSYNNSFRMRHFKKKKNKPSIIHIEGKFGGRKSMQCLQWSLCWCRQSLSRLPLHSFISSVFVMGAIS